MSQCDQILAVLADGRPHSYLEIHERVGFCRLNSRVSELRERGHEITCDKTGGDFVYQLRPAPLGDGSSCPPLGRRDPAGLELTQREEPSPSGAEIETTGAVAHGAAQLSLLEAA